MSTQETTSTNNLQMLSPRYEKHERKNKMNVKRFALCGMLAPIVFALALVFFSMMTIGYSNLTNAVSELGVIGAPYALA